MNAQKDYGLTEWTHPSCYVGATWDGFFSAPTSQNRDSDYLTRSNFVAMVALLKGVKAEWTDEESQPWQVVRDSHWAVGWVEWIAIHSKAEAWLAVAGEAVESLE